MLRGKRLLIAIAVLVLIPILGIAWYLGSPLFTNKTVEEEFPFAFEAEVPANMEMKEVEMIMAGMAKVDSEVSEKMPDTMMDKTAGSGTAAVSAVKVKTGKFRDHDRFHQGSGSATIYRGADGSRVLRLETFSVTNGPELHVLLSPSPDPENEGVKGPGYADLGMLKGNIGNQNYDIPKAVDVAAQNSVVIYCKPFHVIFSVALLEDAS